MRCTIVALSLIALVVSATSMAYAEPDAYRIRATLSPPDQEPRSMTYTPGGNTLLFKDEAACRDALINDQVIVDNIAKLMATAHVANISTIVECVPAEPSI